MDIIKLRRYFHNDLGWGKGYQSDSVFNFLIEAASFCEGGVILDAGCGHQRYKPFFESSTYIGQEHPVAGKENKALVTYDLLSDVKQIPLKDSCIDVILSTSSLEHFEYPQEFFNEAHRVLKPGGKLFVNVPANYPMHEQPFDFQRPTKHGLVRHFDHAGFDKSKVTVKPSTNDLETGVFMLKHALKVEKQTCRRLGQHVRAAFFPPLIGIISFINLLAKPLANKVPGEFTEMPVGWLATGQKNGIHEKYEHPFTSAKDFLEKAQESY